MTNKIAPALTHLAVPIAELQTMKGNPRRGDIDALARSLDRFGQRIPIVASKPSKRAKLRTVYAGNHRLEAARQLGWDQIPVIDADDLSERDRKAFALADNRISEIGYSDRDDLRVILEALDDEELLGEAGFDDKMLAELLDMEKLDLDESDFEPTDGSNMPRLDERAPVKCPNCGESFVPPK